MASIVTCPACRGEVPLPTGPLAAVRCPRCQKELQLSAQIAEAEPSAAPPPQYALPPKAADAPPPPAPTSTVAEYRKRAAQQAQRPSTLGQMVGIMAGGMLGAVMGYWLLNYFGGPRYDFLHIPLPLVPHTQAARQAPPQAPAKEPILEEEEPPPTRRRPLDAALASSASSEKTPPPVDIPRDAPPPAFTFPSYSTEELGVALAAAHAAAGCANCNSTGYVKRVVVKGTSSAGGKQIERKAEEKQPCDVCGGKPSGRITAESYATFCQLAEVVTFLDASKGTTQLSQRREAVQRVLLRVAADRERQAALGRMAAHHLANAQREAPGIVLAGTVQQTGRAGQYHWLRLLLFGLPEEVVVVSRAPARSALNARVLIAGSILPDPRQRLAGYDGSETLVVYGGMCLDLPADR